MATLAPDGTRYTSALWAIDLDGGPARRLTRSEEGEAAPIFTPEGALLFTSSRPVPKGDGESEERSRLWSLPPGGGEAALIADPPGGVLGAAVARRSGTVLLRTALHPDVQGWEADTARARARTEAKVTAQLIEHYPARFWDRWLGPRQPHLYAAVAATEGALWHGLTPQPGYLLEEQSADIADDGRSVVLTRAVDTPDPRDRGDELVRLALAGSAVTAEEVLVAEHRVSYAAAALSPDARKVAVVRQPLGTPQAPPDHTIVVIDLDEGGAPVDVLPGFDHWPDSPTWMPDGKGLIFLTDDDGRRLPFHLDLGTGTVTRLASEGAWSDLVISSDGATLYAARSDVAAPPHVVALPLDGTADGTPRVLYAPAGDVAGLGRVERIETTAEDGARVPGWLVLPPESSPATLAPLAVLVHGGPFASWTGWHWRWNPHVLAARGYAVLCPDPALSTGYGLEGVRRGWGRWGAEPYTDILALTDAVVARPDVDATRTAALGGSFGGYMVNWIAGHTDRFDAIVTHASLWNLEAFHGTTDLGPWWENEFGDRYTTPERYREWSPHRFVADITTPMLVIHGERDYRVPVSEGLALWTDLRRHGVPGAYLHFPDEHHWIIKPPHARVWYETVVAFLDHHVLGQPWQRPDLL